MNIATPANYVLGPGDKVLIEAEKSAKKVAESKEDKYISWMPAELVGT